MTRCELPQLGLASFPVLNSLLPVPYFHHYSTTRCLKSQPAKRYSLIIYITTQIGESRNIDLKFNHQMLTDEEQNRIRESVVGGKHLAIVYIQFRDN